MPPQYAKLRAQLFALNTVQDEQLNEDGSSQLKIQLSLSELDILLRRMGLKRSDVGLSDPEIVPEW